MLNVKPINCVLETVYSVIITIFLCKFESRPEGLNIHIALVLEVWVFLVEMNQFAMKS